MTESNPVPTWAQWLVQIVKDYGPGEYIVHIKADGSVTVKRPQPPIKFEHKEAQ